MAHEISIREDGTGEAMYVDVPAWHRLGVVVPGAQTWAQTIELSGLNWQVEKRQLEYAGVKLPQWGCFRGDKVDPEKAYLGPVGRKYNIIQNEFAFTFVDTVLEAIGGAHYESAGALGKGERIWCLARVPFDFSVAGVDRHITYLLFTNSHDASVTCTVTLTDIRVVCNNTLQAALGGAEGKMLKIRHTGDAQKKLDAAREMVTGAAQTATSLQEKLDILARRQLNTETYKEALDRIFPPSTESVSSSRRDALLLKITEIFENNDDNAFPQFRGTAYNLVNAVTRFVDHQRSVRFTTLRPRDQFSENQIRAENAMFGTGEQLKEHAFDVLFDMAA